MAFLRRIAENWKLKALAFALAVLLWVVVSADQPTTGWFTVPLEISVTDPNYRLADVDVPEEVEVRFAGPGRDLLDLALRRPTLRLTVSDVEEDVEARALDPRMVQLSGRVGVDALDVRPSVVQLAFTRIETRTVPVQPRASVELGDAWAIVDTLRTEPATVQVTGPVRQVETITAVQTEPFRVTAADTIIDVQAAIDTTELPGIQLSARTVRVTGRLDRVVQRTIQGVPIDVGPGVSILPTTTNVTFSGAEAVVDRISPEFFRVVISIDEIPPRIPPAGVLVPLRVDGLRPGVRATLDPGQVRLLPRAFGADTLPPAGGGAGGPAGPPQIITTPR